MAGKPSRVSIFHPLGLKLLYASASVLLAMMVIGTVYTKHHLNELRNAKPIQTDPVVVLEQKAEALPVPTNFVAAEMNFAPAQNQAANQKIINILLIGQDDDTQASARSDAIILCTFNKEKDVITMTSFLRDLYVKIPGHRSNRLNAAFRFGGVELLSKTLHENFGIEIDGSIQVDFGRFEEIIDKLGGVTIELTAAEAAFINKHLDGSALREGAQLLNGEQALLYARDRYDTDGDFSRTNRQRKLLHELIDTYKSKKLTQMLHLMQEMVPMITTDISKSDMAGYAITLFPMLSSAEVRMQAIPAEGAYSYQTIGGKSVLVPDMEKNLQALEDTLT